MIKIHPEPFMSCVVAVSLEDVEGLEVPTEFELLGEVGEGSLCGVPDVVPLESIGTVP